MRTDLNRIEVVEEAMAAVLRGKTPAQRLRVGFAIWNSARRMIRASLSQANPEWPDEELDRETAL
ncbi:MAG: hypothetical protein ACYTFG_12945, partial [Planctomycetota bacterium]